MAFICTGSPENSCGLFYCDIHFTTVVWNQTWNISEVCLYNHIYFLYYALLIIFIYKISYKIHFSSITQLSPTLCNPMDCSMPGFPVHHQLPLNCLVLWLFFLFVFNFLPFCIPIIHSPILKTSLIWSKMTLKPLMWVTRRIDLQFRK